MAHELKTLHSVAASRCSVDKEPGVLRTAADCFVTVVFQRGVVESEG